MSNPIASVTVLYHFFYPDDVISARLFSQFAEDLARRQWTVTVFTSNRFCHYPDKKIVDTNEVWQGVNIIRCERPAWNQANRYLRLANSLWMMLSWVKKIFTSPSPDVIIIGTDPQFSALIFPILRLVYKRSMLVYWCYDLYPEAIIAEGMLNSNKFLARIATYLMKCAYRHVDLMVDIGPCMRRRLDLYRHQAHCATLIPWALVEPEKIDPPDAKTRSELFPDAKLALLYSGNLGKAHDFALFLELARRLYPVDPQIIFCFAYRGNRFQELTAALRPDDHNIRLAPFANEAELAQRLGCADIHLLSLRPEWEGIVVPSKFFGSLAVGKPVLYAGPDSSAIAEWINRFEIGLVLNENNLEEIVSQLLDIANNPNKLTRWQNNSFQAYQSHFAKKIIMDRWDNRLKQLLKIT